LKKGGVGCKKGDAVSRPQAPVHDITEILLKVGLNTYTLKHLTLIVGESLVATTSTSLVELA